VVDRNTVAVVAGRLVRLAGIDPADRRVGGAVDPDAVLNVWNEPAARSIEAGAVALDDIASRERAGVELEDRDSLPEVPGSEVAGGVHLGAADLEADAAVA